MLALRFAFWQPWPAGFVFGRVLVASIVSFVSRRTIRTLVPVRDLSPLMAVNTIRLV